MENVQKLGELLSLLESSYTCKDTAKLTEITRQIEEFTKNEKMSFDLIFQGLSLTVFNNKEISLDLHKSLATNLKHIIMEKKDEISNEQILALFQKTFQLFFSSSPNPHLSNESLISIFENILKNLLKDNLTQYQDQFFTPLCNAISLISPKSGNFITTAKIVIRFCKLIFYSKIIDKDNYSKIITDYYLRIIDTVLKNVSFYINPNINLFNDDYFSLLDNMIDNMYSNLKIVSKFEFVENEKFNEIIKNIFDKYCDVIYELIKIQVPLDKESQKVFLNQNPIIIFNININYCSNINYMKSKCFQFFTFITEQLSPRNKASFLDSNIVITDEKLIETNAELIKLIISSLQDILENKQKFDLIQKPKEGLLKSDSCYNTLLFNMTLIFLRGLIREPIKSEFASHIKYFLLNIIFPLIVSTEEEKKFLEEDADTYQIYIDDLIINHKFRNFRTALCYLIKKLCDDFNEMNNFVLSYVIQMITYMFNSQGNITNNNINIYNIYLDKQNSSLINDFNDEVKIDFCFLLLLTLKDNIVKNNTIKNKFLLFLIQNQEKIHQINSNLILVKICNVYKEYSIHLFKYLQSENDTNLKKVIIEKMINFLLNNILSNKKENDAKEVLVSQASETILNIFKLEEKSHMNYKYINDIIVEKLQMCFKYFVNLIDTLDNPQLNIVISCIIENIHIKDRQDIINCLQIFTKKFITVVNTNYKCLNNEDELKTKEIFISQYFILIRNYLRGKNKLALSKQNEIMQFNQIISPVISYITQPDKYSFYEEIVNIGEQIIITSNSLNEISFQILDNLYLIIRTDEILSGNYFSFLSTFLSHINNNENYKIYINKVLDIIKLTFSFPSKNIYDDILCTLLLNLQILGFEGQIDCINIQYLILENIRLYFSLFVNINELQLKEIFILNDGSSIEKIKQVIVANFSLFFLYYPDLTLTIIQENANVIFTNENKVNNLGDLILKFYSSILENDYYSNLGKCDLLCLCSISRNSHFKNIFNDINKRKLFLKLLIKFALYHKDISVKTKSKIINDKLNCDFINNSDGEKSEEEEFFERDESEDEFDGVFYENVQKCLQTHANINSTDEFKIFSETFYIIKNNEEVLFNYLINSFGKLEQKIVNDLTQVRNIKIEYNGRNLEVPRKTLKIKRSIH